MPQSSSSRIMASSRRSRNSLPAHALSSAASSSSESTGTGLVLGCGRRRASSSGCSVDLVLVDQPPAESEQPAVTGAHGARLVGHRRAGPATPGSRPGPAPRAPPPGPGPPASGRRTSLPGRRSSRCARRPPRPADGARNSGADPLSASFPALGFKPILYHAFQTPPTPRSANPARRSVNIVAFVSHAGVGVIAAAATRAKSVAVPPVTIAFANARQANSSRRPQRLGHRMTNARRRPKNANSTRSRMTMSIRARLSVE